MRPSRGWGTSSISPGRLSVTVKEATTPRSRDRRRTLWHRIDVARRGLAPYARPYRRHVWAAVGASLVAVTLNLALPWPLRGIVELTLPESERSGWLSDFGSRSGAMAWLVTTLIAMSAGIGFAEHRQRLAVAKFTVGTVNDARLGTLNRHLASSSSDDPDRLPGDVLTRTVGDTARLRVGLRGVLVHVLQHGIFVIGVCVIFMVLDIRLGLAYLVGVSAAVAVAAVGTSRTATVARKRRIRDSHMAELALRLASDPDATAKQTDPDRPRTGVEITRIKGRTSVAVQGVLGLTACAVLLVAVRREAAGHLRTGDLVIVASYLLMLHHPLVRLGRQITRLGPQLASAERLARLGVRSRSRKTSTAADGA